MLRQWWIILETISIRIMYNSLGKIRSRDSIMLNVHLILAYSINVPPHPPPTPWSQIVHPQQKSVQKYLPSKRIHWLTDCYDDYFSFHEQYMPCKQCNLQRPPYRNIRFDIVPQIALTLPPALRHLKKLIGWVEGSVSLRKIAFISPRHAKILVSSKEVYCKNTDAALESPSRNS